MWSSQCRDLPRRSSVASVTSRRRLLPYRHDSQAAHRSPPSSKPRRRIPLFVSVDVFPFQLLMASGLTTGNDPKGPVTRAARCCAALVETQEVFLPAQRTRSAACACERPITPKPYSIVMIRGANRRPGVVYPVGAGEIAWKLWNLMQMRLL